MMRCSYSIEYFRYSPQSESFHSAAKIVVGMRESFAAPKHGQVALTTEPDAMAVMFNSASNHTPEVRYGTRANELDRRATGSSSTYKASDMSVS
jgi:hypothetical protein